MRDIFEKVYHQHYPFLPFNIDSLEWFVYLAGGAAVFQEGLLFIEE
jgi:hypothetical protein